MGVTKSVDTTGWGMITSCHADRRTKEYKSVPPLLPATSPPPTPLVRGSPRLLPREPAPESGRSSLRLLGRILSSSLPSFPPRPSPNLLCFSPPWTPIAAQEVRRSRPHYPF